MGLHAYFVQRTIGGIVFDCQHPHAWHQRLLWTGKFSNGVWMEFTAEELAQMATDETLAPDERQIVRRMQHLIVGQGGEPLYLEYF